MPAVTISDDEIRAFVPGASDEILASLIPGTLARAALFAPCIKSPSFDAEKAAAAKDILVGVIARAVEEGSGAMTNMIAGPFQGTQDTSKPRGQRFTSSEVRELRNLCDISIGGAFSIPLVYDEDDAGVEGFRFGLKPFNVA